MRSIESNIGSRASIHFHRMDSATLGKERTLLLVDLELSRQVCMRILDRYMIYSCSCRDKFQVHTQRENNMPLDNHKCFGLKQQSKMDLLAACKEDMSFASLVTTDVTPEHSWSLR